MKKTLMILVLLLTLPLVSAGFWEFWAEFTGSENVAGESTSQSQIEQIESLSRKVDRRVIDIDREIASLRDEAFYLENPGMYDDRIQELEEEREFLQGDWSTYGSGYTDEEVRQILTRAYGGTVAYEKSSTASTTEQEILQQFAADRAEMLRLQSVDTAIDSLSPTDHRRYSELSEEERAYVDALPGGQADFIASQDLTVADARLYLREYREGGSGGGSSASPPVHISAGENTFDFQSNYFVIDGRQYYFDETTEELIYVSAVSSGLASIEARETFDAEVERRGIAKAELVARAEAARLSEKGVGFRDAPERSSDSFVPEVISPDPFELKPNAVVMKSSLGPRDYEATCGSETCTFRSTDSGGVVREYRFAELPLEVQDDFIESRDLIARDVDRGYLPGNFGGYIASLQDVRSEVPDDFVVSSVTGELATLGDEAIMVQRREAVREWAADNLFEETLDRGGKLVFRRDTESDFAHLVFESYPDGEVKVTNIETGEVATYDNVHLATVAINSGQVFVDTSRGVIGDPTIGQGEYLTFNGRRITAGDIPTDIETYHWFTPEGEYRSGDLDSLNTDIRNGEFLSGHYDLEGAKEESRAAYWLSRFEGRSGSYSDFHAEIDEAYRDGALTRDEYVELNGEGLLNLEEDISYAIDIWRGQTQVDVARMVEETRSEGPQMAIAASTERVFQSDTGTDWILEDDQWVCKAECTHDRMRMSRDEMVDFMGGQERPFTDGPGGTILATSGREIVTEATFRQREVASGDLRDWAEEQGLTEQSAGEHTHIFRTPDSSLTLTTYPDGRAVLIDSSSEEGYREEFDSHQAARAAVERPGPDLFLAEDNTVWTSTDRINYESGSREATFVRSSDGGRLKVGEDLVGSREIIAASPGVTDAAVLVNVNNEVSERMSDGRYLLTRGPNERYVQEYNPATRKLTVVQALGSDANPEFMEGTHTQVVATTTATSHPTQQVVTFAGQEMQIGDEVYLSDGESFGLFNWETRDVRSVKLQYGESGEPTLFRYDEDGEIDMRVPISEPGRFRDLYEFDEETAVVATHYGVPVPGDSGVREIQLAEAVRRQDGVEDAPLPELQTGIGVVAEERDYELQPGYMPTSGDLPEEIIVDGQRARLGQISSKTGETTERGLVVTESRVDYRYVKPDGSLGGRVAPEDMGRATMPSYDERLAEARRSIQEIVESRLESAGEFTTEQASSATSWNEGTESEKSNFVALITENPGLKETLEDTYGINVDGIIGSGDAEQVRRLQASLNVPIDGQLGPQTMQALNSRSETLASQSAVLAATTPASTNINQMGTTASSRSRLYADPGTGTLVASTIENNQQRYYTVDPQTGATTSINTQTDEGLALSRIATSENSAGSIINGQFRLSQAAEFEGDTLVTLQGLSQRTAPQLASAPSVPLVPDVENLPDEGAGQSVRDGGGTTVPAQPDSAAIPASTSVLNEGLSAPATGRSQRTTASTEWTGQTSMSLVNGEKWKRENGKWSCTNCEGEATSTDSEFQSRLSSMKLDLEARRRVTSGLTPADSYRIQGEIIKKRDEIAKLREEIAEHTRLEKEKMETVTSIAPGTAGTTRVRDPEGAEEQRGLAIEKSERMKQLEREETLLASQLFTVDEMTSLDTLNSQLSALDSAIKSSTSTPASRSTPTPGYEAVGVYTTPSSCPKDTCTIASTILSPEALVDQSRTPPDVKQGARFLKPFWNPEAGRNGQWDYCSGGGNCAKLAARAFETCNSAGAAIIGMAGCQQGQRHHAIVHGNEDIIVLQETVEADATVPAGTQILTKNRLGNEHVRTKLRSGDGLIGTYNGQRGAFFSRQIDGRPQLVFVAEGGNVDASNWKVVRGPQLTQAQFTLTEQPAQASTAAPGTQAPTQAPAGQPAEEQPERGRISGTLRSDGMYVFTEEGTDNEVVVHRSLWGSDDIPTEGSPFQEIRVNGEGTTLVLNDGTQLASTIDQATGAVISLRIPPRDQGESTSVVVLPGTEEVITYEGEAVTSLAQLRDKEVKFGSRSEEAADATFIYTRGDESDYGYVVSVEDSPVLRVTQEGDTLTRKVRDGNNWQVTRTTEGSPVTEELIEDASGRIKSWVKVTATGREVIDFTEERVFDEDGGYQSGALRVHEMDWHETTDGDRLFEGATERIYQGEGTPPPIEQLQESMQIRVHLDRGDGDIFIDDNKDGVFDDNWEDANDNGLWDPGEGDRKYGAEGEFYILQREGDDLIHKSYNAQLKGTTYGYLTGRGADWQRGVGATLGYRSTGQALSAFLWPEATNYLNKQSKIFDNFMLSEYTAPHLLCSIREETRYENINEEQGESSAFVEIAPGVIQFVGAIQAEKTPNAGPTFCSEEMPCQKGECGEDFYCYEGDQLVQSIFYKISWTVSAPSDEAATPNIDEASGAGVMYNVQLEGDQTIFIYPADSRGSLSTLKLVNGDSDRDVFVTYSTNNYNRVCIKFHPKYYVRALGLSELTGDKVTEICADFKISTLGKIDYEEHGGEDSTSDDSVQVSSVGSKQI